MKTYRLKRPQSASRLDYENELNEQQGQVVMAGPGAHLVIAGAGSGKTRTLTYRVARLLEEGVPAESIALCTFTNKAAREMLQRVEHLMGGDVRRVSGGTFHHLANGLLREHAQQAGYEPNYTILDQEDAKDLLGDCLVDRSSGSRKKLGPSPAVVMSLIGLSLNTLVPLEEIILHRSPRFVHQIDELLQVAQKYQERKKAMNVMDFDDLLFNLFLLLEQDEAGTMICDQFQQVLVDEYQDTSALQCQLVDRLAAKHGNITVVGDDAQSIYGFRGADSSNIIEFQNAWPEALVHKLEINYRSSPQILALANSSIAHNTNLISKTLRATCPEGPLPALIPVRDADMQASFVAQRVVELAEEGVPLNEQAVLYRAHHHSMELQVELTRREIPYQVRSGVRFFEQAHIKDVLAHLRVVLNPSDQMSWLRILRLQPGIGRRGASKIWESLSGADDPLVRAEQIPSRELPARNRKGFSHLLALLLSLAQDEVRSKAGLAIASILSGGYGDLLTGLYNNPDSRRDDIEQLASYAEGFGDSHDFLAELNLLASFASEMVLQDSEKEELLTLSSIHQAKGLEWRSVFMLSLNEGSIPHPRSIQEDSGLEEERRLFYVALTRAKEELYLLTRQVEDRRGRNRILLKTSRFIDETAGEDLFELWSIES